MGEITHIEWTDHTFNPWEGCTKVSPGCAHCYAEARNARFGGGTAKNWGKGAPRRRTSPSNWKEPFKWNSAGMAFGIRPRVFCASLADWLDDEVPVDWLGELMALIRVTTFLEWQLLTKRPENWFDRIRLARNYLTNRDAETAIWLNEWLPKKESAGMSARVGKAPLNVWIGTTIEDDDRLMERHRLLMEIPARVHFWSAEPLLSDLPYTREMWAKYLKPDWVICGGESGPGARPMRAEWARRLRDKCKERGVPFFFKQWGEYLPFDQCGAAGIKMPLVDAMNHAQSGAPVKVGKIRAGSLLDGIAYKEFPR